MRKPDLFIVGAPKCGTTALAKYLGEHPAIFMSTPKEPHYFATDLPGYRVISTADAYADLFAGATESQTVLGEASVFYLYSREAIPAIRTYNPQAKIIVMLRNPVDMVYSMHAQVLHSTDEDQPDFLTAWQLQAERRMGKNLPRNCRAAAILQYRDLCSLGEQVERLLGVFPREQVKIILFDDFKRDPRRIYQDVLGFIGVPDDGRSEFPVINANKFRRFYRLSEFFVNPPEWFYRLWAAAKKLPGLNERTAQNFHDWLERANTRVTGRSALAPDVRAMLVNEFRGDVEHLSHILHIDLSSWVSEVDR